MAGPKTFRRLKMGLSTILGFRPQGFFIPYRYADTVNGGDTYHEIEKTFINSTSNITNFIFNLNFYATNFSAIGADNPPQPRWNQSWFSRLDAAAAYAMVREHRPEKIIEVGSGHSTRFMARAVADGQLETRITAIDPAPRATVTNLDIDIINATVQSVDQDVFAAVQSGDILFIDSSHILMPGTDVDYLLNRILPSLPAGVLVHIHDIFLPDGYPPSWTWRGYNEQSAVAALLQGSGYEILFASHFAATRLAAALKDTVIDQLEKVEGAFDTSLWLRKITL